MPLTSAKRLSTTAEPCAAMPLVQRRVERDGGVEHLRHRAVRLGGVGELLEFVARHAGDLTVQRQRDGSDAPTAALLLHREIGPGLQLFGWVPGAAEPKGQRHGEAAGMSGCDQL